MKYYRIFLLFTFLFVNARTAGKIISYTQNKTSHPVLKNDVDLKNPLQYEERVKLIMSLTEEQLLTYIPDKSITVYCECPKCYGGVQGNSVFKWDPQKPDEMECKYCGAVYPNKNYPENETLSGKNSLGETVTYKYYLNKSNGVAHFLTNNLMFLKRTWLEQNCEYLGKAYYATKNEKCANRLIFILDKIATYYSHYSAMQNSPRQFRFLTPQNPSYPWDGGRWGYFYNELSQRLIRAYDFVYDSPDFENMSLSKGYNVKERIENDFFNDCYKAALVKSTGYTSNIIGYDPLGALMLGRVIPKPEYVHWALGWIRKTIDRGFYNDGMWPEGLSYHKMTVAGLNECFSIIKNYSDPAGYVDPVDKTRIYNFDPDKSIPFWAECQTAPSLITFPNGNAPSIGDSHPYEKQSDKRDESKSVILPDYGLASLGAGKKGNQIIAQLHYGGNFGHGHSDILNLNLWSKGLELFPDLGYTHSQMRYWATSTLAHNLVVVDKKDQENMNISGGLTMYYPNINSMSVVEANSSNAYHSIPNLNLYSRLLVLIPVSGNRFYLVDVFRVNGGSIHDWTLNGDADKDMDVKTSISLESSRNNMLGNRENWKEPAIETDKYNPYGLIRNIKNSDVSDNFTSEFIYPGNPNIGIRTHFLIDKPMKFFLGKSPSVRRINTGTGENMRKVYDYWMPKIILRDSSSAPLKSVFTVIHEPYENKFFIKKTERLKISPADSSITAFRITYGDTTDTIINTPPVSDPVEIRTSNNIIFKGRFGIVRQVKEITTEMWLFQGEKLAVGNHIINSKPDVKGRITNVLRIENGDAVDGFETDNPIPNTYNFHGKWILLNCGNNVTKAFEIDSIYGQGKNNIIKLVSDPGLQMSHGNISEIHYPVRTFTGEITFTIPLYNTWNK